jgi:dGTP triphosphohydrolase
MHIILSKLLISLQVFYFLIIKNLSLNVLNQIDYISGMTDDYALKEYQTLMAL